jgi:hypothetical protein
VPLPNLVFLVNTLYGYDLEKIHGEGKVDGTLGRLTFTLGDNRGLLFDSWTDFLVRFVR